MRPCPGGVYWLFSFELTEPNLPHLLKTLPWAPCIHLLLDWPKPSQFQLLFWNWPFIVNFCWIFRYLFSFVVLQIFHFFHFAITTQTLISCQFLLLVACHLLMVEDSWGYSVTYICHMLPMWFPTFFSSVPSFFPSRFLVFLRPLWFLPSFWKSSQYFDLRNGF